MRYASILLLGLTMSVAACNNNDNSNVVATGIAGNNFFATWQITSTSSNNQVIPCVSAGAKAVRMAVFKEETGVTIVSTFACDAYQGLSDQQFETDSTYDVRMDLLSPLNQVLATIPIDNLNITIPGTVDLGLITFVVP